MSDQKQSNDSFNLFYERCATVAEHINNKRAEIHKLLAVYETSEVIDHEIESSIRALKNVAVEYDGFERPQPKITACCYMPVNMPLYSLVLYALLPAYYFETMYIRPGVSLNHYIPELVKLLDLAGAGFRQIIVKNLPAKLFTDLYAKDSEVILFTGKYENALMLERECPESLLIFEGTGPCPFFIFENADTDLAVDKAVGMRCFNSGQDCVAPDVLFVHQSKLEAFTTSLKAVLSGLRVGNSEDPNVRIAQMIKDKYLFAVQEWLEKNRDNIVFGGEVDTKHLTLYPTILVKEITEHSGSFTEFFSPVFYILSYADDQAVLDVINTDEFQARSMYASVFGTNDTITKSLALCTILKNSTVNDQEDGNQPYGGYGATANFVSYKGKRRARPLLISRDIREWLLAQQRGNLAEQPLQVA